MKLFYFFLFLVIKDNIYKISKNSMGDTDNASKEENNIMPETSDFNSLESLINPVDDNTIGMY